MIGSAPLIEAARTAESPTPPTPNTATASPGCTRVVWITAPAPVSTAQPMIEHRSAGSSAPIGTRYCSETRACSLQVNTGHGMRLSRYVAPQARSSCPNGSAWRRTQVTMAWSPFRTRVTALPVRSTTPVASWPNAVGRARASCSSWTCEWQMPLANSLTTAWSGRGSASCTSSIISGSPLATWMAARVVMGMADSPLPNRRPRSPSTLLCKAPARPQQGPHGGVRLGLSLDGTLRLRCHRPGLAGDHRKRSRLVEGSAPAGRHGAKARKLRRVAIFPSRWVDKISAGKSRLTPDPA